jgi:UDPglucose 6-dehydrogenase
MREASSLVLAARLLAEGAKVRAYDPVASVAAGERLRGVELFDTAAGAVADADAAVLVTEWRQIVDLDWAGLAPTMKRAVLIDGRNAVDPTALRAAGFVYEGIGRA